MLNNLIFRHGIPVKLTENVLSRYNKALDLLKVSDFDRRLLKPFTVFGFDMWSAGSLQSKWGGIVGIPINFTYLDGNTIAKHDILVKWHVHYLHYHTSFLLLVSGKQWADNVGDWCWPATFVFFSFIRKCTNLCNRQRNTIFKIVKITAKYYLYIDLRHLYIRS